MTTLTKDDAERGAEEIVRELRHYANVHESLRDFAQEKMLRLAASMIESILAAARIREAQGGERGEEARHGIYVASRVRHASMWQQARKEGTPIISSWIDEAGEGETADFGELWLRIQREVTSAERLVFFAEEDDFPFKGALVEVGMALAAGVPVFVVIDPDVELDGRTLRPLGSWAKHPNVTWASTLYDAFSGIVRDRKD